MRTTAAQPFEPWSAGDTRGRLWPRTDSDGRFELTQVPAGTMGLAVTHPEWTRGFDGPFEVALGGGGPVRWIELAAGGRIRGQLLSARGEPLTGERVALAFIEPLAGPPGGGRDARTDGEGRFVFEHLEDGLWQLSRAIEGGDTTVYDLSTGVAIAKGASVEVELRPRGTGTLVGSLRFAGEVPELVTMRARRVRPAPDAGERTGSWRSGFAQGGRFMLEGLEAGEWVVSASCDARRGGVAVGGEARVEVAEGGTAEVWIEIVARE